MEAKTSFYKKKFSYLFTGCPKPRNKKAKENLQSPKFSIQPLVSNEILISVNKEISYEIAANSLETTDQLIQISTESNSDNASDPDSFGHRNKQISNVTFFNNFNNQDNSFENENTEDGSQSSSNTSSLSVDFVDKEFSLNASLLCLFFSTKITQNAFKTICEWTSIINKDLFEVPKNFDQCLKRVIKNELIDFDKTWFCKQCSKFYIDIRNKQKNECEMCGRKMQVDFKLSIEQQLRRVFKKNKELNDFKPPKSYDILNDIYDGRVYSELIKHKKGGFYTFLLNTDGIALCEKSKISIWPIILVMNELSLNKRFTFDNIIIAGISISNGKPNLGYLLDKVKEELEILELGINLNIDNYVNTRFFLISAVFDKPARSSVLNMIGPTGYYSCLKCLQIGKRLKTEKGGSVHTFPFQTRNPEGPKRTIDSYESHLKLALKTKECKFGIKDECILSDLSYFHPIRNTLIDTMHSISLGVLKSLFSYWFEHPASKIYSLKNKMFEIDDRLKRIRPPSYVPNAPRSIFDWKLWRAHEYMSFILLYSIMVFYNIMDLNFFNNLIKLVIYLEVIFSNSVQKINLLKINNLIKLYLKEITRLYDPLILKSGFHELLHLSELTLDFGPLNCSNCFPFEEINRKITGLIKGQNLIGEEFIKLFNACQQLATLGKFPHENEKLVQFIEKHSFVKTSNFKNTDNIESVKVHQKIMKIQSSFISDLLNQTYGVYIENVAISQSVYYKNIFYSTKYHEGKFGDFSIYDQQKNIYGIIWNIIIEEDNIFLFCNEVIFLHCPFFDPNYPEINSKTFKAKKTDQYFITKIQNVQKVLLFELNESSCFICTYSFSHLFS